MPPTSRTPSLDGLSMPPRYAPHERTYISWPTDVAYRWSLEEARSEHAFLAKAIAPYEKVTLLARPQDVASVSEYLEIGDAIELLEIPLDVDEVIWLKGDRVRAAQVSSSVASIQFGGRFCTKAARPSAASAEAKSAAIFSAAIA